MLWDPNLVIYVYQGHSDKNYIEKVIKNLKMKKKKEKQNPWKNKRSKGVTVTWLWYCNNSVEDGKLLTL